MQLREEKQACGHQAAYFCIFAAITSERGVEDVTTIIEASDDCILTSAGCNFNATGQVQLHRHLEAGLVQALAREQDMDRSAHITFRPIIFSSIDSHVMRRLFLYSL